MTGLFGSLGTATRGMNVNQTGLQTSGHNIANTNTDGYSRQRVHMQAETPYRMAGVGMIGMGVKATSVDRIVDSFIRGQIQGAYSQYRMYEQKSDALGQLEGFLNEPSENGIINQLSELYDAWTKLGSNPELGTSKTLVVEYSNSFTDMVRGMATNMQKLKNETIDNIEKGALDFNKKVEELAVLNDQIFAIASNGSAPNDLLDTRDKLLKDLSGLADVSADFDQFGRVSSLKIGGASGKEVLNVKTGTKQISVVTGENQVSVGGDAQKKESITGDYPLGTIVVLDESGTVEELKVSGGEIGGFKAAAKEIEDSLESLDDFVAKFAVAINETYANDNPKAELFFEGTTADTIKVNEIFQENPSKLVIGEVDLSTDQPLAGDGSIARKIGELFSKKDISDDDMTFAERFNNIVTKNGISKQQADNTASSQLTLLNQLEYKNESVSGVNLNEEVSDVIRFSQAFQANARVIQTISEMLDTLINRTGV